jgi:hypothetical protein
MPEVLPRLCEPRVAIPNRRTGSEAFDPAAIENTANTWIDDFRRALNRG